MYTETQYDHAVFSPSIIQGMVWMEPVATTKLLGCLHSPHQKEFCIVLGRHALHVGMLRRTL